MAVRKRLKRAYGFGQGLYNLSPKPIVAKRAPTTSDMAELGTIWIDKTTEIAYTLIKVANNQAVWGNQAVVGTNLANLTVNPGPTDITGDVTVNSAVASTIDLNAGTGGAAIATTGALALSSSQAAANCIDLTASDVAGSVRIQSAGDLAAAVDIQASAGGINLAATGAAGQDIQIINTGGSVTMTASEAAANAIRIAATNAAGGLDIDAGTAGVIVDTTGAISLDAAAASNFTATGAFDVTVSSTAGSVNIIGGEAATDAVLISASSATGGITLDAGVLPGVRITNGTQTAQIMVGTGDPNGTAGLRGSIFLNVAGVADTILWVNVDGGTTWTALTST